YLSSTEPVEEIHNPPPGLAMTNAMSSALLWFAGSLFATAGTALASAAERIDRGAPARAKQRDAEEGAALLVASGAQRAEGTGRAVETRLPPRALTNEPHPIRRGFSESAIGREAGRDLRGPEPRRW